MALRALQLGDPTTILQNEVYALPAKLVQVAATVACEVSVDGIAWTALTSDTITAAAFIRCATANSVVICKAADKSTSPSTRNVLTLSKRFDDPPPPLEGANLWLRDNTAGKTRLFIQFNSGPRIQLAIEP